MSKKKLREELDEKHEANLDRMVRFAYGDEHVDKVHARALEYLKTSYDNLTPEQRRAIAHHENKRLWAEYEAELKELDTPPTGAEPTTTTTEPTRRWDRAGLPLRLRDLYLALADGEATAKEIELKIGEQPCRIMAHYLKHPRWGKWTKKYIGKKGHGMYFRKE